MIKNDVAIIENIGETHSTKKLFEVSPFISSKGNYELPGYLERI